MCGVRKVELKTVPRYQSHEALAGFRHSLRRPRMAGAGPTNQKVTPAACSDAQ